jgi:short-subunit dehydrogenase
MKNAIITGAANGIGRATTKLLAKNGWKIAGFDLDEKALLELQNELGRETFIFEVGDVTNPENIKVAYENFNRSLNGINLLINNAGIIKVGDFTEIDLLDQQKIVEVNLTGVITSTHIAIPYLKSSAPSTIINMCSAAAIFGNSEITIYAATKAAIKNLTEGLNILLENQHIHVAAIWPIYVKTRMVTEFVKIYKNVKEENIKLTAEDVAKVIYEAANDRNRIHWLVGTDTKLLYQINRFIPTSLTKWFLKKITHN